MRLLAAIREGAFLPDEGRSGLWLCEAAALSCRREGGPVGDVTPPFAAASASRAASPGTPTRAASAMSPRGRPASTARGRSPSAASTPGRRASPGKPLQLGGLGDQTSSSSSSESDADSSGGSELDRAAEALTQVERSAWAAPPPAEGGLFRHTSRGTFHLCPIEGGRFRCGRHPSDCGVRVGAWPKAMLAACRLCFPEGA